MALEAGCGVGAQTAILLRRSPGARLISMDISQESLAAAARHVRDGVFIQADAAAPPMRDGSFDHVFVCFLLEHLAKPQDAIGHFFRLLRPGGAITVIEGDHEACVWTPWTAPSAAVWRAMIRAQQDMGHDPLIGRRLYSLLAAGGFEVTRSEPRVVHGDGADPALLDAVVNKIIVPMAMTARERALAAGYLTSQEWEQGVKDIQRTALAPGGAFFYSWFKAVGRKPPA
ncbi:MAG: methyltransferase domain-containing protein [Nitrospinota bacterium]|nr:methyltransferase domain-containing protein [Nitrospinota bacterium]